MARVYYRDWRGRFATAGSTRGPVLAQRTRSGSRPVEFRRRRAGYTPTNVNRPRNANARVYIQRTGRHERTVIVTRLRNGRATMPKDSIITRRAVGGRTGRLGNTRQKIGSPINGNKNLRYVARGHAITRAVQPPLSRNRVLARAYSNVRRMHADNRRTPPRSGYVVAYGPRVRVSN